MEAQEVIREWGRRRSALETVHNVCALGILGVLVGSAALDGMGIVDLSAWTRIGLVAALAVVDLIFVVRICRCPNCGRYPGIAMRSGSPTGSRRMAPFGWAVCLKCKAALRDD